MSVPLILTILAVVAKLFNAVSASLGPETSHLFLGIFLGFVGGRTVFFSLL